MKILVNNVKSSSIRKLKINIIFLLIILKIIKLPVSSYEFWQKYNYFNKCSS